MLGTYNVTIPGKEKPAPKSLYERINAFGYFFMIVIIIITLIYYMNYTSARTAFRWAYDFLQTKTLSKAGHNMMYAFQKDDSYSDAYLLSAKLSLCINDYRQCLIYCSSVEPHTNYQTASLNYLIAKCNFEKQNYTEAEKYFDKLLEYPDTRDSAWYYKSKLLIMNKKQEEALKILEKSFPVTRNDSINFIKIKALFESEKYTRADSVLNKHLVKTGSNLPQYYYWNGQLALAANDTAKACYYFNLAEKRGHIHSQTLGGIHCYTNQYSVTDTTITDSLPTP